ncbi:MULTISPECIES: ABC-F family ATP-binding cassette domain-containing protein [unclassified Planococcus (in: firmicutes)]|uniref:ABC-F family ATP-binding cassette domain-containing protein n=1 Tax=Planococcus TaxID=1372 RepID=UPI000C344111|nr:MULTISPECIES: ATP-binding cassette domain-containing protein [unclassified Planococcus (in: firmicutes)]AUD13935.1 ABC transporter ATP-binding protein [Planococcus sp. MB-3u-03]PKG47914.1 ABC transporter ATP-binding protein [Planococcus sp. Urea-trap-24]PKG91762.1 ABC transporter ATP-binding protein [Planococcus sp. Urea-3u-39]PKH43334.1 ABC transporter ATP-binding protein [Planococcus sp. MB-3u-09]
MIAVNDVSLRFGDRKLFEDVNIQFNPGNCYGLIGANGAGKSTFIKILSGELEAQSGNVYMGSGERLAVLKQNHFEYEEYAVLETVIMGHKKLYEVMSEKNAIYMKEDFSDEDGMRAAELEGEFAELNGWEAESEAAILLQGLGISEDLHDKKMAELSGSDKVKVLLAQALFGKPDVLLLDEPTNHLDLKAIQWLEEFLINFDNTVIVVSHDRHFLNKVCTHIADLDFGKIQLYVGNYDFWYESSQLATRLASDQNAKKEEKIKELQAFIARFSANASKSKQATSRKKMLDKIELDDIRPSSRKYPFVNFTIGREIGNDVLTVKDLSQTVDGNQLLNNISFNMNKDDKIVLMGDPLAKSALLRVLAEEDEPASGSARWGVTTSRAYLPIDNTEYFEGSETSLVDWLRQYSPEDESETFLRGFLGRMLFSGEEVKKKPSVLSGGEKVRCMLSKMMLSHANVLLLDEPTNHLDLESIQALNNGMIAFKGAMVFTSHDHQFIQTVANRVIEIQEDGSILDKQLTYDEFLEWKEAQGIAK